MYRPLESYTKAELAELAVFAETSEGKRQLDNFLFNQMIELEFNETDTNARMYSGGNDQNRIFWHTDSA